MEKVYVVFHDFTGLTSEGMLTGTNRSIFGIFKSMQEALDCLDSKNIGVREPGQLHSSKEGIDDYYHEEYVEEIYVEEIEVGKDLTVEE